MAMVLHTNRQFSNSQVVDIISLEELQSGQSGMITAVETDDDEIIDFLFTLGCYPGEVISIISRLAENMVVLINDSRYSINSELAEVIYIRRI